MMRKALYLSGILFPNLLPWSNNVKISYKLKLRGHSTKYLRSTLQKCEGRKRQERLRNYHGLERQQNAI